MALDRLAEARAPHRHHIANKEWSRDEDTIYYYMYELTESICHNHWCVFEPRPRIMTVPDLMTDRSALCGNTRKPAETELWDSDDSDVPYSDPHDVY